MSWGDAIVADMSDSPASAAAEPLTQPPLAPRRPTTREIHGHTRVDDYEWLRDKDNPEVIAHLEAENAWTEQRTAHLAGLRSSIFEEIRSRTLETDLSVPTRNRGYWYYGRSFEGKEYGASCRVPVRDADDWTPPRPEEDCAPDQPALPGEEVLLDLNALAEGHEFFSLGGSAVSLDDRLLAWSVDTAGDERYTVRFKDLTTGELLPDELTGVLGNVTWHPNGVDTFYSTVDESWRPDKVWRHRLGTSQSEDELVLHETDGRFWTGIGRSRDARFLMIALGLQDHERVPLPRHRRPRRDLAGLRRAPRGPGVLPRARPHRWPGGLPGPPQRHRPRLRDRAGAGRADPAGAVAPVDPPRPGRTPGGRRRLRRSPGRAPAQRRADPAAHHRAHGRRW